METNDFLEFETYFFSEINVFLKKLRPMLLRQAELSQTTFTFVKNTTELAEQITMILKICLQTIFSNDKRYSELFLSKIERFVYHTNLDSSVVRIDKCPLCLRIRWIWRLSVSSSHFCALYIMSTGITQYKSTLLE